MLFLMVHDDCQSSNEALYAFDDRLPPLGLERECPGWIPEDGPRSVICDFYHGVESLGEEFGRAGLLSSQRMRLENAVIA